MPRGVDSDEEHELKVGRRTRAAAIVTAPNTPVRRSTRNRHGSVNPDGSSPESIADSVSSNSKINTRRRAANIEPAKATRGARNTRRASLEPGESDQAPSTPIARTTRRSIAVVTPVERPKPTTRNTKRVTRISESESSPLPTRVTRRTRAMSAEPEFIAQTAASSLSTSHEGTPTKTRRGRALALPKEPAVMEEVEEVKSRHSVIEESDESENSMKVDPSGRLSTIEASPKNTSRTGHISDSRMDVEDDDKDDVKANQSPGKSSKSSASLMEQSSDNDSFTTQKSMSPTQESEPSKITVKRKSKDFVGVDSATEIVKISTPKSPIVLKASELDKSKEVGVRIEDLLNKSIEKQQSPGNKENEKVNVSSEKIKKNLEFDVSPARVVVSRRSSNSTPLTEKHLKSKLNKSLDEQVLSENSLVKASTVSIDGDNVRSRRSKTLDKKLVNEAPTPNTDTEISVTSQSRLSESTGNFASDFDKEKTDNCFVKLEKLAIANETSEDFVFFDSTESIKPVSKSITGKKNSREVDDDETDRVQSSIDEEPSSRSGSAKMKLSGDESSSEQRTGEKNKNADDDEKSAQHGKDDEGKSTSQPRRLSLRSQRSDTPNKSENNDMKSGSVFDSPPSDQADNEMEENNEPRSATRREAEEHDMAEDESADEGIAELSELVSLVESDGSLTSEKQCVTENNDTKEKVEEESNSPKPRRSKKHASLRASDAESDTIIDGLFQDISADEWVSKYKHCSLADTALGLQNSQSKLSPLKSISGDTSTSNSETCGDRPFGDIPNSDASEKGRKSNQIIIEIEESDAEMVVESANDTPSNRRKSLNKSAKSTASPAQRDESPTDLTDVEDDNAKFSTDESNDQQNINGKSTSVKDTEVEAKQKTPKNLQTKLSDKKSTEKSRKSLSRICDKDESSDDDSVFVDLGSTKKSKTRTPVSDKKQKQKNTPVSKKDYLTVDCLNSDSLPSEIESDDAEYSPSIENSKLMPSFLFNVVSSDSENSEKCDDSMNSDIAREMNLDGDSNVAYSDDDVPGDECRASESEHSDDDDDGSDLIDFVVDDDEAESSAESEPSADEDVKEPKTKNSYKRLLNVFTSDEEGTDEQSEDKSANVSAESVPEEEDVGEAEEKVESQTIQNGKEKLNVTDEAESEAEEKAEAKDDNNEVDEEKELEGVEAVEDDEEEDEGYDNFEEESGEEDGVEAETEREKAEEASNRSQNPLKTPHRSMGETDSSKLQSSTKKSKRSLELDKSQSSNSAKNHRNAKDSTLLAPPPDNNLPKSIKKLRKLDKSVDKFDTTIDIATPDPSTPSDSKAGIASVPSKDTSTSKKKKLKNLIESYANLDATIDLTTPNQATPKSVDSKSAPVTPAPSKEIITSKKKLKKLRESYAKANATIGLEASDEDADYLSVSKLASVGEPSGPNTSLATSSGKKKRKSVSQDDSGVLDVSTRLHDESNASNKHDPKVKTPRSASKTNNFTAQSSLGQETPRNTSKLNKTVMTPCSETPQTKFLKKERLNESLPLIMLNSRRSKSFTKSVLLHDMNENDREEVDSDGSENSDVSKKSGNEGNEANNENFNNEDEVSNDGAQDDEDQNGKDDESNDENGEDKDHEEIELKLEDDDEEEEVIEEQTKSKKKKKKSIAENVEEPDDPASKKKQKQKKSQKSKNLDAPSEPLIKKKGDKRKADLLNDDEMVPAGTNIASKFRTAPSNGKGDSRENSESRSKIVQKTKKPKNSSATEAGEGTKKKVKPQKTAGSDSDSDDAPESLDFVKARDDALATMKNIATNLKVAMEAKKKKRRDQLEKIKLEKEAKLKKLTTQGKVKPESGKLTLKRLPEDVLEHLSDAPNQPQKRRKLLKGEEITVPSKSMFSSENTVLKTRIKVDNTTGSTSSSGGTTQFNVVSIERVKKEPKKALAVASFRDRMLSRNPRQAPSAYQVYQTKQKASGKDVFARRKK